MMKKLFILLTFIAFSLSAQVQDAGKRFIEVTGTGEIEIVPDEIYVTITLQESKEKEDLAKQEQDLKKHLQELGIDGKNLSLNSADADYRQFRTFKKEVVLTKTYILKISDASMLSRLYERLDKMDAHDAYVSRIDHSKILEHTKEARIKAIKAAKDKAGYLLAAIGHEPGLPIQVLETENFIHNPVYRNQQMGKAANVRFREGDQMGDNEMSFRKIRIKSSFLVKYEIK